MTLSDSLWQMPIFLSRGPFNIFLNEVEDLDTYFIISSIIIIFQT